MRRAVVFLRSVLPADPAQLLFLCGSIFLFIALQLRWWPEQVSSSVLVSLNREVGPAGLSLQSWISFVWWPGLVLFVSGAAGLFICLWPGSHPVPRALLFVFLPSFLALSVICSRFLYLARDPAFPLLDVPRAAAHNLSWAGTTLWQLGPGLHFSIVGLLLTSIFLLRMGFGLASLPIALTEPVISFSDKKDEWNRILLFVWFCIASLVVVTIIAGLPFLGLSFLLGHDLASGQSRWGWIFWFQQPLISVLIVGAAAWAVGRDRWKSLRQFLRVPRVGYLGLGLVIPVGVWTLMPLVSYLHDRIAWAETGFGKIAPPWISSYFTVPGRQLFLFYIPAAFFEEIVWRGYLQPRFVQRYGLFRGLFVLSIAWGAFHFQGDFGPDFTDGRVLLKMLSRLVTCVTLGLVLSWLTLRSGSILPAALAHGFSNVLLVSSFDQHPPLARVLEIVLWALLAWVLFRFWPPRVAEETFAEGLAVAPEPPA
jgi:membrane protease YdiL (CAAX protease family)